MQVAQRRWKYTQVSREIGTGTRRGAFSPDRWMISHEFEQDVRDFVKYDSIKPRKGLTTDAVSAQYSEVLKESFVVPGPISGN
jgi:hypothetical protein